MGGVQQKGKSLIRKRKKGDCGCVQELASKRGAESGTGWLKEKASINLKSLCVSLKGGTGLFVGGDPRCLPWKGTAHCFKSWVTWGGHQKEVIEARKNGEEGMNV